MSTHAKILILFCTVVSLALGQQVAVKTGDQHALILPGKMAVQWTFHDETRVWLTVVTSNHRDWPADGYDPSFTSVIVKDYKPVVHLRKDGTYEVTFTSPIAEDIP